MPTISELKAALSDPAYYRSVGGGLLDAYNRGAVGGLLGTPVDMANGVLNAGKMAAGYIGHQTGLLSGDQMPQPDMMPVGGSEWIGQKMQDAGMVSPNRNMPAEMLAGLAGIPLTAMAAAKAGPMVEKGIGQAMANAQMPSTLNMPQYSGQRGAIAYHGSPHKFDKFSLDKIGTGEGAQAYGHGLYLAEAPDTAQAYANKLTQVDGRAISDQLDSRVRYLNTLKQQAAAGDTNAAKTIPVMEKSIADLKNQGSLYKVDLPDEHITKMLDWDKPLSQQHPDVQAALFGDVDSAIAQTQKSLATASERRAPTTAAELEKLQRERNRLANLSGGDYYRQQSLGVTSGQPVAADALKSQGIPGIRYLDGGSRSTGAGTSNYVAFDPEMIRILERNGQPTGLLPWQPGEWGNK